MHSGRQIAAAVAMVAAGLCGAAQAAVWTGTATGTWADVAKWDAEGVPDTATEIVLYCRGGNRSALAADALQTMGYTNVLSLRGGYREWEQDANRPRTTAGEPIQH